MHEILLHGKRLDNGEWVEGFYISDLAGKAYICQKVTAMYAFDGARCYGPYIEVDPDTLGRETGLTDRNGKRIFEGDVVTAYWKSNDTEQTFRVIFESGAFLFENGYARDMVTVIYGIEVIGNIHDNPELMERGREA